MVNIHKYPIIYKVWQICQVVQDFFHQQYALEIDDLGSFWKNWVKITENWMKIMLH